MSFQVYGKIPSGARLERIKKNTQYQNNVFMNLSPTPMLTENSNYFSLFKEFLSKPKSATPPAEIPSLKTNLHTFSKETNAIIWFGHSSYIIFLDGKTFLIDPVLSGYASPFSFMIPAFKGSDIYKPEDIPEIDFLILTHDHYDHLDYKTLSLIKSKVKNVYCSLGSGSHLEYWKFDANIIHELAWNESDLLSEEIKITSLPARHFSGRGISRNKTQWCSFVLKTSTAKIFIGGDSGYDLHFKEIGKNYGPFHIALLECGQYHESWKYIHMMPEQTVQACIDLQAEYYMPVHWGKFSLSLHTWNEPIIRTCKEAENKNVKITTPLIGEPILIHKYYPTKSWWNL